MRGSPALRRLVLDAQQPANATHVRTMALLCFAAAVSEWLVPLDPDSAALRTSAALGALAAGILYWTTARWFRVWTLHLVMVVGLLVGLNALASADNALQAAAFSTSLLWTGVLAATIYSPRVSRVYAVGMATGNAVGLWLGEVPTTAGLAIISGATTIVLMEVLNRMATRLRLAAISDPLTGLWNRAGLHQVGARTVALCHRAQLPLTAAVLDLDEFKRVNDEEGHAAGDQLLVACSDAWRDVVEEDDVLARPGGDEFVLLMPGADRAAAIATVDRLAAAFPVAWSHGLAVLTPEEDLDELLARADSALTADKAARRASRRDGPPDPTG